MSKEGFDYKAAAAVFTAFVGAATAIANYYKDKKNNTYKTDKESELKKAEQDHQREIHQKELLDRKFKASLLLLEKYENMFKTENLTEKEKKDLKKKINELRELQHNYIVTGKWDYGNIFSTHFDKEVEDNKEQFTESLEKNTVDELFTSSLY